MVVAATPRLAPISWFVLPRERPFGRRRMILTLYWKHQLIGHDGGVHAVVEDEGKSWRLRLRIERGDAGDERNRQQNDKAAE